MDYGDLIELNQSRSLLYDLNFEFKAMHLGLLIKRRMIENDISRIVNVHSKFNESERCALEIGR